ncbi:MAG: RNA polymerase sigma-70 factor [Chitinophagaceae bacterium]|nr:RNA polymerase sigma-70 factor [Chitinophagaceae bacterium]
MKRLKKPYSLYTDEELLSLLRDDDETALSTLYDRYWDKLLSIAFKHSKDKSTSKEIVQELFISLWNRRSTLQIDHLDSYLATAVKFSVFKLYYREHGRADKLKLNAPSHENYTIDEIISAKFLEEYLNGIVETLPEKCRTVFKYSREQGMKIPEIAAQMGISEKTVEAHLTKSLKTLRLHFNKDNAIVIIAAVKIFFEQH